MGGSCSTAKEAQKEAAPTAPKPPSASLSSAVHKRLVTCLQEKAKELDTNKGEKMAFDKIVMNFGRIRKAFESIKAAFDDFDQDKNGTIEYHEFVEALKRLGAAPGHAEAGSNPGGGDGDDQQFIKDIFQESDFDLNSGLDFKEFTVTLAICYLLGIFPQFNLQQLDASSSSFVPKKVDETRSTGSIVFEANKERLGLAFYYVIQAYLYFDVDGVGVIDRTQVDSRMQTGSRKSEASKLGKKSKVESPKQGSFAGDKGTGTMSAFLTKERMDEMDWDKDGTITFKEFLYAFQSWIGMDDNEEE